MSLHRLLCLSLLMAIPVAHAAEAKPPAPDTKATPAGRDISYNSVARGPRSPEEERRGGRRGHVTTIDK